MWLGSLTVATVLRTLFSNRIEGRDQVDFFFWLRSRLQAFSLLVSARAVCFPPSIQKLVVDNCPGRCAAVCTAAEG